MRDLVWDADRGAVLSAGHATAEAAAALARHDPGGTITLCLEVRDENGDLAAEPLPLP